VYIHLNQIIDLTSNMLKPLGISVERKAPRWGTQAQGTNLMPGLKMRNAHPPPPPPPSPLGFFFA